MLVSPRPKRVMNALTYMQSSLDPIWEIAVQQANMRFSGKTCAERLSNDVLI